MIQVMSILKIAQQAATLAILAKNAVYALTSQPKMSFGCSG
jgi:hypothetical protein